MTTTTTQALFRSNDRIAQEFARTGRMVNKPTGFFPTKPKSQQTLQKERATAKYESKRNQCPQCHTARSVSGDCMC